MHGRGTLYYENGEMCYDGQWRNDKFDGLGCLFNENPHFKIIDYKHLSDLDIQDGWTKFEGYWD